MAAKFSFIKITIPTINVNHTALYNDALTFSDFQSSSFQAMYKTDSNIYKKYNRDSREHDEVISRAVKVMGLKVCYKTKKNTTRYAVIYAQCRTEDTGSRDNIIKKLREFVRKYQRIPTEISLKMVYRYSDL